MIVLILVLVSLFLVGLGLLYGISKIIEWADKRSGDGGSSSSGDSTGGGFGIGFHLHKDEVAVTAILLIEV